MIRLRSAAIFTALLILAGLTLHAQVTGTVTGTVLDATGAAVPEATVSLELPGANTALFTAQTTNAGDFTMPSIPPNTYDLFVEAKGFQKTKISGVIVNAGRALAVPT